MHVQLETSNHDMLLDRNLVFERVPTQLACAYWHDRRGDRPMPARGDLVPSGMRKFMPHVGLIDVIRGGEKVVDYRIRLAGTRWEAVYGPMTGRCLGEFLSPTLEARWREAFDNGRSGPVRLRSRVTFEAKVWLDCEIFIAPLSESGIAAALLFLSFTSWNATRDAREYTSFFD